MAAKIIVYGFEIKPYSNRFKNNLATLYQHIPTQGKYVELSTVVNSHSTCHSELCA